MNPYDATIRTVKRDLDRLKLRWALVGAGAVSARSAPRTTNDIDVAVSVAADAEAEQVVHRLLKMGYAVEALLEDKNDKGLVTVRLRCPQKAGTVFLLDLLFRTSGIEREVVDAARPANLTPTLSINAAATGHLIAMKVLSARDTRPNDVEDIVRLVRVASEQELERARKSVRLMTERGYGEGRDLPQELESHISRALNEPPL